MNQPRDKHLETKKTLLYDILDLIHDRCLYFYPEYFYFIFFVVPKIARTFFFKTYCSASVLCYNLLKYYRSNFILFCIKIFRKIKFSSLLIFYFYFIFGWPFNISLMLLLFVEFFVSNSLTRFLFLGAYCSSEEDQ